MLAPGHLGAAPGAGAAPPTGARLWWRRGVHALVIVAGWGLFFWGWQRVLAGGPDFSELRLLMLGAAVVVPVITVSWILHNRGIHRRKGPRRSVPAAQLDYRVDFHGHAVVADFRSLAEVRCVEIVLEGAMKRYRVAGLPVALPGPSATDNPPAVGAAADAADALARAAQRNAPGPSGHDVGAEVAAPPHPAPQAR